MNRQFADASFEHSAATTGTFTATLLLRGGSEWSIAIEDASALARLRESLTAPDNAAPLTLLLQDGRSLTVHPREIIGVVTGSSERPPQSPLARLRGETALAGSPYVVVESFLTAPEEAWVFAQALSNEHRFTASSVSTGSADYRRSRVLYDVGELASLFLPRLQTLITSAWPILKTPPATIQTIECQLTAHGDGDFFKVHNDNGSPDTARRLVSYVYYFYREPKKFSGGQLRIYETLIKNATYARGERFEDVEPAGNSLVLFPSYCHHEVLPVAATSDKFADRRFTVNGWFVRSP